MHEYRTDDGHTNKARRTLRRKLCKSIKLFEFMFVSFIPHSLFLSLSLSLFCCAFHSLCSTHRHDFCTQSHPFIFDSFIHEEAILSNVRVHNQENVRMRIETINAVCMNAVSFIENLNMNEE